MGLLERLCTNASLYLLDRFLGVEPQKPRAESKAGNGHRVPLTLWDCCLGKKKHCICEFEIEVYRVYWASLCPGLYRTEKIRVWTVCDIRWQKTSSTLPAVPPAP